MRPALVVLLLGLGGCGPERDLRRGDAALEAGDLVGAEVAFRAALDREPGNPRALYGIGWTWHLDGREDMARSAFEQILAADPKQALGHKGLGSLALGEGNLVAARAEFEAALAHTDDDLALRHSLVLVDLAAGDGAAALVGIDTLIARDANRAELHGTRAEVLMGLGRGPDALEAATRAVSLGGTVRSQQQARLARTRALLWLTTNRVDRAQCSATAPPVRAWLAEANHMLDEVVALGSPPPDLVGLRRSVQRREGLIDELCGPAGPESGKVFPGG